MTTTRPAWPLTETEKALAGELAAGLSLTTMAAQRGQAPSTVRTYLSTLRRKMGCPGAPRHVLVHAVLSAGQAPKPAPPRPAPTVSPEQTRLWHALASNKLSLDVAHTTGITPAIVKRRTAELLAAVGADDLVHLVVLGHAWNKLSPDHAPADTTGADQ
ncbi:helix-turn-helix transcriptional regulator [Streptomyces sp. NPDC058417]|uniref:helix-turn-helix transcriptional regulator n=1 Tax=unclassified Streptomyces TaxID=2593676 RepID=UPI0036482267